MLLLPLKILLCFVGGGGGDYKYQGLMDPQSMSSLMASPSTHLARKGLGSHARVAGLCSGIFRCQLYVVMISQKGIHSI